MNDWPAIVFMCAVCVLFFFIFCDLLMRFSERFESMGERQDRPPFCIEPTPFHSPDNTHGG